MKKVNEVYVAIFAAKPTATEHRIFDLLFLVFWLIMHADGIILSISSNK